MDKGKIIAPFKQALTLQNLPAKGAISDKQLEIIEDAGIWVKDGKILAIDTVENLLTQATGASVQFLDDRQLVLMPAFIDCHTHACFAGNRAKDYALRIAGESYLTIAKAGGGILDSVSKTREASEEELTIATILRTFQMLRNGITTIEIKSGYGLSVEQELKMLRVIQKVSLETPADIISTCLAAHTLPPEFSDKKLYLHTLTQQLFPVLLAEKLCKRIDIFVEETAFPEDLAYNYLQKAKDLGFEITIHADQFSTIGSRLAVKLGALSADHLEASGEPEIKLLANSDTVAVVLPGASMGLGMAYAPARRLLDAGASVAISTDFNPGSAPMGDLLLQASVMAAQQKLTTAETFAAITFRAAHALNLRDRGILKENYLADFIAFSCEDYREILYWQGKMHPKYVWKRGELM